MSVQGRRAKLAISLLGGKFDTSLEQFERITNGEQNPLGKNCFASLDIDGNVMDVEFMSDGRIFVVTKRGQEAKLWELGFPNRLVAKDSRIDLLGEHGGRLFFERRESRNVRIVGAEPKGNDDGIVVSNKFPSGVDKPTIHPMAGGNFVAVWQIPADDNSIVHIGDFRSGRISSYPNLNRFVPLEGGGYVVFWRDVYVGKLTWIKSDGEKFERMLDIGYRGDTAAVINGELWFSEVGTDSNSSKVVRVVGEEQTIVCRGHKLDQLIFDGDRPAVWEKNSGFIRYLDEVQPQERCPFTSPNRSFAPIRFGSWLLFQTLYGEQERFAGFNDLDESAGQIELRPEGNWDILKIVGNYLLMASTDSCWDVFYVFDSREEWISNRAVRHLPSGCKAERLRIVGDKVCCWSTVGRTLHLYRVPI